MNPLVAGAADLWERIPVHPFVVAAADGSLPEEAFGRWLVEDHHFVVGFRRFLARLVAIAPDEAARDVLAGALAPLQAELDLFRAEADRRGLDLGAEPNPTTLGYTAYVQATADDGWATALTVLYGVEKAYFDAWCAVRATAETSSPYWAFIDNWSSDAFGSWVADIEGLLDHVETDRAAFERVVRFELRFWDAVHRGEQW